MRGISVLAGLLAIGIVMQGCSSSHGENSKKGTSVYPVTEIITKDTILQNSYVTGIEAVRNVEVRARVGGFLDGIYVDEGQEVKKGQLLFRINDTEFKTELARAKAALNSIVAEAKAAELEVERVKLLVNKKVISSSELPVAEAKLSALRSRIEEARSAATFASARLSYANVRAPFDGFIDRIPLKTGSLISEGTLLTSVSDVGSVYAYFKVSENEYLQYIRNKERREKNWNRVSLVLADGSLYSQPGTIETVESEFEESTGSIAFRATFPNPQKHLKHGATGRILLSQTIKNAVIVPQKSVFEIQDKNFVFLLGRENKVKMQSVSPVKRFSHFYIVSEGLKQGDKIVYEGLQDIRDGVEIKPRYVKMDSILTASR
ncbi:efflux RND transporter periplasmic adaptor subunit [Pararcticibacter amylolyticus]|uniref:Efflux transporter periplasmic adaptor subunit n=1 Tax=Pararcticibacter amylolyticus TaxID=2173175 RepID=A0A2U2PE41_9SPHI|nr:efflux RND transporter periplasmic adaptor subunit [Pararcticibacter amylolyticus]PWG79643.1 efflux transporter periplasmic adaptor subunit [Pararcticibacter amylolyticus]